jgi:stearoyl-CoA desaturase (delta-9 desaturase)
VLLFLFSIHSAAIAGVILFPLPGWPVFLATLGMAAIGALSVTVCYHRGFAHRSVYLHPWVEQFLTFWAVFTGSSTPRQWSANHRLHHAKSDTPEDVSSPRYGGFFWAHLGWLYRVEQCSPARWCPDLDRPRYRLWDRLQVPIVVGSFLCGAPFGWAAFFWMGPIRLVYLLHMQALVNSVLHMGPQLPEGIDSSRNLWWLGPFQLTAWGENWHRNHHAEPNSARYGWSARQVDIGWYAICAMEKLGLADRVKRPRVMSPLREVEKPAGQA